MSRRKKPQLPPLTEAEIQEAVDNIEMCLTGLDEGGEEGLQRALDKIYGPRQETKRLFAVEPFLGGGRARVLKQPRQE